MGASLAQGGATVSAASSLSFDAILTELARRASRQTAALYTYLVGRYGATGAPLQIDVPRLLADLRASPGADRLFDREDEFRLRASLWELGNWAIAWPGRASPRPVRRLLKWFPDRSGFAPGPTSTARVIRIRLASLPVGDDWQDAYLVLL